ncbi:Calpain-15 [Durusdinium trenchii]|uniref:Calpain-15 n=1 Tax=Durusdinium trenchii TaxID=1381693 RepID=A0ABP0HL90_9DINO
MGQSRSSQVLNVLFVGGAILIAVYSWAIYGLLTEWLIPLGSAVHPDMQQAFNKEKAAIYIHAMASATALAIGPFQVIPSWRRKHMLGHRRAGRVYFVCCFAGSISGMTLSLSAQGGMVGKVGFFSLGVVWLLSELRFDLLSRLVAHYAAGCCSQHRALSALVWCHCLAMLDSQPCDSGHNLALPKRGVKDN